MYTSSERDCASSYIWGLVLLLSSHVCGKCCWLLCWWYWWLGWRWGEVVICMEGGEEEGNVVCGCGDCNAHWDWSGLADMALMMNRGNDTANTLALCTWDKTVFALALFIHINWTVCLKRHCNKHSMYIHTWGNSSPLYSDSSLYGILWWRPVLLPH